MLLTVDEALPELLTSGQAARTLGISVTTLRRWEQEGAPGGLIGQSELTAKGRRYRRTDIIALRESLLYNSSLSRLSSRQLLTRLAGLMRTVSCILDAREMAQTVVNEAVRLVGSKRSSIYLLNSDFTLLLPYVAVDIEAPQTVETLFLPNPIPIAAQPLFGQVLAEGQPVYIIDTYNDPRTTREFFERFGNQAFLAAPLRTRNRKLLGFLSFSWANPHFFTDEELIFAEALADQTAVGLENARLLQEQQERASELETVFDTMAEGVAVYDTRLQLVRVNKAAERILAQEDGFAPDAPLGSVAYHQKRNLYGQPLQTEETPAYRAGVLGQAVPQFEMLVNGESGRDTVLTSNAAPFFNETGSLAGGVVVFRNITAQYRAQRELERLSELAQSNAAMLRAIIESAAEGVVFYDNSSRIVLINAQTARLYNLAKEEIEGLTSAEFGAKIRPLFTPAFDLSGVIQRVENSRESYIEELEMIAPQRRTLQRLVTPVLDSNGETLGKVALYRDVTEERNLARAKDEFISLATHELKTPLTSITGFAQLLQSRLEQYARAVENPGSEKLPSPAVLLLPSQRVSEQARRLNDLMNDLLDASRISTGQFQLELKPTNLPGLVERAIELVQVTTASHELRLVRADRFSRVLLADVGRLEQVVRNLLVNAVKYSPAGGVIEISVSQEPAPDGAGPAEAQVAIRDRGIGVAPDQQARLFERFFRASNAAQVAVGLGLGLSICAEIIRQHGGRIWAESAGENQGSTFKFTLPLVE